MPIPNVPNELALGGGAGLHGDDIQVLTRFLEELRQTVSALEAATASIPVGGTVGQFLAKKSPTDFDLDWQTAPYADYVFNSSLPKTANRFDDWQELMETLSFVQGPKTVTFEQDETIPAGAYDFSNTTFRGNFLPLGAGGLFVTLADGVTFTDITQFILSGGIGLVNGGSAPNLVIDNNDFVIFAIQGNSGIGSTGAPMFVVGPAGNLVVAAQDGSTIAPLGQPVIEVQDGAALAAVALGGVASSVQDGTISGDGAVFVRLIQGIAVDVLGGLSQPDFSGIVVDQLFTDSRALGYDPSGTGGTLAATNVQAAIDELAGLV